MLFRTVAALCSKEPNAAVFTCRPLGDHMTKTIAAQKRGNLLAWLGIGGVMWGITSSLHPTWFLCCMVIAGTQARISQLMHADYLGIQVRRHVESCLIFPEELDGNFKMIIKYHGLTRELGLQGKKGSEPKVTVEDIISSTSIIHFDDIDGKWTQDSELIEMKERAFQSVIVSETNIEADDDIKKGLLLTPLMDLTKENLETARRKAEKGRELGLSIDARPYVMMDKLAQSAFLGGLIFSAAGMFSLQRKSRE